MSWGKIKGTAKAPVTQTEQEIENMEAVEAGFAEQLDTDAMIASLKAQRATEAKTMRDIGSTDYYFCVFFNNEMQMVEFCKAFGFNPNNIFMDGREVAKQFRKALSTPDEPRHKTRPASKEYLELAQGLRS